MFSLFKKKASQNTTPEWASFFDDAEYTSFIEEIERFFKSLNVKYRLENGFVEVEESVFGSNILGLTNVAQVCKQEGKKHFRETIALHFDALIKAEAFDKTFKTIINQFDEIKQYVGVRLYHHDYLAEVGKENAIVKDFAGDIYAVLVFDLPHSVVSIKPEQAAVWNKSQDELFEIGLSNIEQEYPVDISKELIDEFQIWLVQADHFFAPNVVFDLENRPELVGRNGSLVGLPHRHAAIIYPIESIEVVKAVNRLMPIVYGMNQEGPGSLSNHLFWYHKKSFSSLPYKIQESKLQFYPPDDFVALLNELGK